MPNNFFSSLFRSGVKNNNNQKTHSHNNDALFNSSIKFIYADKSRVKYENK